MKIVVVGGVAAGMSAAARARRLSEKAEIVVLERSRYVSYANCGLPYYIGGAIHDRGELLLQTPRTLAETLNLDVRTGHEVTAIHRAQRFIDVQDLDSGQSYRETYERLVLCPGASPIRPDVPGVNHPRIFMLRNIEDMDAIKAVVDAGAKSAIVVGGGYVGIEVAENFRRRDLDVSLVEMLDQVMPPFDAEMARDLQYHLEYHGVRLYLGSPAIEFVDQGSRVGVTLNTNERLTADVIVLAAGVRPDVQLAKAAGLGIGPRGGIEVNDRMQTSDPFIYAAGDAVEVVDAVTGEPTLIPLAGPGNRQGRVVADCIFERASAYGRTQGTAVIKVFEMTGGGTGANEKTLRRLNRPFRKVYIHPSGHASYYPGTAPMQMKLLFTPKEGRLLGAQVVGYDGVDKRLDVLATAIRAGLTVYDLEHLELAYAPQFGAAKDPINMAGFVAANLLRGDIDLWYAEDYPAIADDAVIVDVRSALEYNAWHIPDAVNIPLGELRGQLDELSRLQPLLLYCRVGFRSYLAYRVLVQSGFKRVKWLAGGSKTFCSYHRTPLCTGRPGVPFVAHAEEQMAEQAVSACAV